MAKKTKDSLDDIKKEGVKKQKSVKSKNISSDIVSSNLEVNDKKLHSESIKNPPKKVEHENNVKFIVLICIIILLAAACVFIFLKNKTNYVKVDNNDTLNSMLGVEVVAPSGGQNIKYGIENDSIAKIDYIKEFQGGEKLPFTLRSSTDPNDDLVQLDYSFGTPIVMETICNDGKKVSVLAQLAITENPTIMKAVWTDNNSYYAMVTTKLTTREDFLQEVNRVIIDTHIDDENYVVEEKITYGDDEDVDYMEEIDEVDKADIGTPSNSEVDVYEDEPEE